MGSAKGYIDAARRAQGLAPLPPKGRVSRVCPKSILIGDEMVINGIWREVIGRSGPSPAKLYTFSFAEPGGEFAVKVPTHYKMLRRRQK